MSPKNILSKIFIKDLALACIIGITEIERQEKQPVLINITLWAQTESAGKTDDIAKTVNYKDIYLQIIELVEHSSFHLLERLAEEIAKICMDQPRVEKVEIRVEKPKALKFAASAGIEIERRQ